MRGRCFLFRKVYICSSSYTYMKTSQELITVPKQVFINVLEDFETLLEDFELLVEQDTMKKVNKRLKDIKEGKVNGLTEADFSAYIEKAKAKVS